MEILLKQLQQPESHNHFLKPDETVEQRESENIWQMKMNMEQLLRNIGQAIQGSYGLLVAMKNPQKPLTQHRRKDDKFAFV